VASGPAHGTTSVSGDVVTYTPTAGHFGADSFTYTATGPWWDVVRGHRHTDGRHARSPDGGGGFCEREL
jgi:hypothetical protein